MGAGPIPARCYAEQDFRECTRLVNARYGTAFTSMQIHNYIGDTQRRLHRPLHSGRTGRFEKGLVPLNTLEPGTEVVRRFGHRGGKRRDPEIMVVLDEPNPWTGAKHYLKRKALVVWEAEHGRVPKGIAIVHIDGDWRNCNLDNLMAMTRAELAVFNRHFHPGSLVGDKESRKAALLTARLKTRAHQREREAATAPKLLARRGLFPNASGTLHEEPGAPGMTARQAPATPLEVFKQSRSCLVLALVDEGLSKRRAIARVAKDSRWPVGKKTGQPLSIATVKRWVRRYESGEPLERRGGGRRSRVHA